MSSEVGPALWATYHSLLKKHQSDKAALARELSLRTGESAPLTPPVESSPWFAAMKRRYAAVKAAGKDGGRWWETDGGASARAVATKIGFARDPPSLVLQYVGSGGARRHRVVHLEEDLDANDNAEAVDALVRRLVQSHGALVGTEQLRTAVLRLQRLMKSGKAAAKAWQRGGGVPTAAAASAALTPAALQKAQKADVGLLYRDREAALKDVDLQDADALTVKEFKKAMDQDFKANAVAPGDARYAYDKRVEVRPSAKSEWDTDDD